MRDGRPLFIPICAARPGGGMESIMKITSFSQITDQLQSLHEKRIVAVVAAHEIHTLEAVLEAWKDNLIVPILIGDKVKINDILHAEGKHLDEMEIIDLKDSLECARKAVQLVHEGRVDCIMKGNIETSDLMRVIVDKNSEMREGQVMSLFALLEVPTYHKLLGMTDVGVLICPTLEQKKEMIENACKVFHALGISIPKIAVMAAVEKVNPKMKETEEAAELVQWNRKGELPSCIIEGPISYDLAISSEAAEIKGYKSQVAGNVDLMVVPDITSGNLLSKSLILSGGAKGAGIVVGAKVPLVLTSRSASSEDKYLSLSLAALVGKQLNGF